MSDLFPPKSESNPIIYAYTLLDDTSRQGQLKVGFTTRSAKERIQEQIGATLSRFTTVVDESAMRSDGSSFSDHDIHRQLKKDGFINTEGEWFRCKAEDVVSAIIAVRDGNSSSRGRTLDFKMRPEQQVAVDKAANHFIDFKKK